MYSTLKSMLLSAQSKFPNCVLMFPVGQGMNFRGPLHGIQQEVGRETEENCENEAFVSNLFENTVFSDVNEVPM